MVQNKTLSMLGLCARAGKVQSGEFSTEKSVKSFRSHLVIVAEDASDNTQKKFRDMCTFYEVPFRVYGKRDALGHAVGKEFRASLSIEDARFAGTIMQKMEQESIPEE